MQVLSIFQRSLLMWMHLQEVIAGDIPVRVQRKAIKHAFGIDWQSHYTSAMKTLQQQGWITVHNYFGVHEYELTDAARVDCWQHNQLAQRKTRQSGWQRMLVEKPANQEGEV